MSGTTQEQLKGQPSYWELFSAFFRIGIFTIGGGLAMMPILERIAVQDKQWFTQEEMTDCLVISQALPGVIAVNMATYTGYKKRGYLGAVLATLGIILPSFLIIIAIVGLLDQIGDNRYIAGAFIGIKAAICGCIIAVLVRNGQKVLKDPFTWIMAIAAFVLIGIFQVDIMFIIPGAALIGIAVYSLTKVPKKGGDA